MRLHGLLSGLILMWSSLALAGTPDFELTDIHGKEHRLSDYQGKWVVVNYWATWCPPCLEEIPELIHFHENHKDNDAVVLGVNYEQPNLKRLKSFVEEHMISYPILLSDASMSSLGPVPGLPMTYLVSPEGRIVAKKSGTVTADGIESFIEMHRAMKDAN